MKISVNESKITLDWWELFEHISVDDKREMVWQVLLFDDKIFGEVVDQMLTEEYASPTMNGHIFKARLRMLEKLPEMARDAIATLQRQAQHSHDWGMKHMSRAMELERCWPHVCTECSAPFRIPRPMPKELAEHEPTPVEKLDALMTACGVPMPAKQQVEAWQL